MAMDMVGRFHQQKDRLSDLPDELLHKILSSPSITIQQAMQMSLLSKRWKNLWLSLPALHFDQFQFQHGKNSFWSINIFKDFVNQVLHLHRNSSIHKFGVSASCPGYFSFPTEQWLHSALSLNAQEISLNCVVLKSASMLGRVKTLQLTSVQFSPECGSSLRLENVQHLEMDCCTYREIRKLTLIAPLLNYLYMSIAHDLNRGSSSCGFALQAPNLASLELKGYLFREYDISTLAYLKTAVIQLHFKEMRRKEVFFRCLSNILKAISNVKSLTLSANPFQTFAVLPKGFKDIANAFHNLNILKLTKLQNHGRVTALVKLLKHFGFLETLSIERAPAQDSPWQPEVKGRDWGSQLSFQSKFSHLKTIELRNLHGCDNEFKFLEFLMKNTVVLEKIIIKETEMIPEDQEKWLARLMKCVNPSVNIQGLVE